MKRSIFMLFIIFIASISMSCVKDGLTFTERRIIGMWEFERVRKSDNLSLERMDLSNEYAESTIEFMDDKSATMVHQGETYEGVWETITGGETTQLIISLVGTNNDEIKQITFSSFTVINNVLRGEKNTQQYWKRYKMRKL